MFQDHGQRISCWSIEDLSEDLSGFEVKIIDKKSKINK